ncbi:MAG: Gfo/Idh/MocA family oxidoreductase [Bacteroidetes bacterium]|nr:Gfo/Idh/MocA family oxidoreductase [Rhodothermia bacterium]MCS7154966.1 Gfo/Idh/MocA family oxidoreductase [Bacteroidota bacterium]MCX7907250.1 Gfo/Idh/MocA family oxidoreductase [Bacteroidota bacterium]MDW8138024.1 Gfo/Idh/MocA family oxidoreductase [Bacteroidota bacterium]MDW8286124.1 Gfo/Idh/MocA family oxidoreductase [Bacteroidota bacterium]
MDRVRLAHVGMGYWGRQVLRNFAALPEVELLWVCDLNLDRLREQLGERAQVRVTSRFEDVLADPRVQAVSIAAPTEWHFEMARRALESGRDVFVEKPMTLTVEEAQRLVELVERTGRILMVGHLLLYHPAFVYAESLIERGELGLLYYLYSTRVNLGIVRRHENAFQSLAPHDIALALRYLRDRPVAISAHGQSFLQPGIEDVVFATLYFESGRIAHLHTSWLDPHKIRRVTLVGSRKMLVIDDVEAVEKVRIYDKGVDVQPTEPKPYATYTEAMTVRDGDIYIPRIPMQEPLRLECEHFVCCVRERLRPKSDVYDGLRVVQVLEAAKRSLQTGRTEPIAAL